MSKQEDQDQTGNVVDGELSLLRTNNKKLTDQVVAERNARKALEEEIEDAKAEQSGASAELTKAQRALKKAEDELARVNRLYEEQGGKLRGVVLANEIDKAMDASKVLPHMREPMRALFMSQVEWDAESGTGSIQGSAVSDHINSYFKAKGAAHFVAAPETSGVGAEGNTKTTGAAVAWTKDMQQKDPAGFYQWAQEGNQAAANQMYKTWFPGSNDVI